MRPFNPRKTLQAQLPGFAGNHPPKTLQTGLQGFAGTHPPKTLQGIAGFCWHSPSQNPASGIAEFQPRESRASHRRGTLQAGVQGSSRGKQGSLHNPYVEDMSPKAEGSPATEDEIAPPRKVQLLIPVEADLHTPDKEVLLGKEHVLSLFQSKKITPFQKKEIASFLRGDIDVCQKEKILFWQNMILLPWDKCLLLEKEDTLLVPGGVSRNPQKSRWAL